MTCRWRTEDGSALVEFVWLGLLLLVPLIYILVAVMQTQSAAYGASHAARSASRAFLTAPDQATGRVRALEAAKLAFIDQGVEGTPSVQLSCRPNPRACLTPGSTLEVRVSTNVALPLVPAVFGEERAGVKVSADHAAPYGQFREARP